MEVLMNKMVKFISFGLTLLIAGAQVSAMNNLPRATQQRYHDFSNPDLVLAARDLNDQNRDATMSHAFDSFDVRFGNSDDILLFLGNDKEKSLKHAFDQITNKVRATKFLKFVDAVKVVQPLYDGFVNTMTSAAAIQGLNQEGIVHLKNALVTFMDQAHKIVSDNLMLNPEITREFKNSDTKIYWENEWLIALEKAKDQINKELSDEIVKEKLDALALAEQANSTTLHSASDPKKTHTSVDGHITPEQVQKDLERVADIDPSLAEQAYYAIKGSGIAAATYAAAYAAYYWAQANGYLP